MVREVPSIEVPKVSHCWKTGRIPVGRPVRYWHCRHIAKVFVNTGACTTQQDRMRQRVQPTTDLTTSLVKLVKLVNVVNLTSKPK